MGPSDLEAHRRGIWVGGADAKIRRALVGAMDLALLPTFLGDPVMASRILCCQFLVLRCRKGSGQLRGLCTERGAVAGQVCIIADF